LVGVLADSEIENEENQVGNSSKSIGINSTKTNVKVDKLESITKLITKLNVEKRDWQLGLSLGRHTSLEFVLARMSPFRPTPTTAELWEEGDGKSGTKWYADRMTAHGSM